MWLYCPCCINCWCRFRFCRLVKSALSLFHQSIVAIACNLSFPSLWMRENFRLCTCQGQGHEKLDIILLWCKIKTACLPVINFAKHYVCCWIVFWIHIFLWKHLPEIMYTRSIIVKNCWLCTCFQIFTIHLLHNCKAVHSWCFCCYLVCMLIWQ